MPLVLLACWAGGALCRRLGRPPVIGEMAAGILLGPALLGRVWPTGTAALPPLDLAPVRDALGQLGLLCFMFPPRREPDAEQVRGERGTALTVGLIVPLVCGVLLALALVAALTRSTSTLSALATVSLTVAFAALMLRVVRPLPARALQRARPGPAFVLVTGGLCLSAPATDRIGVHATLGAFLLGAATPRNVPAVHHVAAGQGRKARGRSWSRRGGAG
nr:cation:proton antiporter [Streptomyces sp. SID10853]